MSEQNLSLDYIKENSLFVLRYVSGYRIKGTYEDLKDSASNEDVKDFDLACWEGQPKELQQFYKDHEYATYQMHRTDLFDVDKFYAEWVKDPKQFEPQQREVIGKLSDYIGEENATKRFKLSDDLIINNYDGDTAGNHRVGNFMEALETFKDVADFDVVEFIPSDGTDYSYHKIIVQTDNRDAFRVFDREANENAIRHDKFMGDGKYEKEEAEEPMEDRE